MIKELTADTVLNAGLAEGGAQPAFNKATAMKDLEAVRESQAGFAALGGTATKAILADLAKLEEDLALLDALKQRSFVQRGLALVDGCLDPIS